MTFFAWLCGLDTAELGRVIANRPEAALLSGPPRDRAELAARLQHEALVGAHYLTPPDFQTAIERLAWDGPVTAATQTPALTWALQHGLVYIHYWDYAEMPGEVGRALRGPGWRPVFTPRPPEPTTVAVAPGMVARESAAAALTVLEQVGALAAECARKPVPTLKTGGVGVRELRRLGKTVGCDEQSVRLWLEVAARELVGNPTTGAIFQADLTAVVPGIPGHALACLLDSVADRESRGGALIWRFSSASVRRALDAGATAGELTGQLIAVSGGGVIPQPLAYLIGDIGRQHGRIRVRDSGCVLYGVEESLLTEVLTAKALGGLGLTRLAPTVLASAAPQAETLAALRAAGYFPAAEQPDGNPQAPLPVQRRASTASPQLASYSAGPFDVPAAEIDPDDLAEQLCGRPPGAEPRYPAMLPEMPFGQADPGRMLFGLLDSITDDGGPQSAERHALLHQAVEAYADCLDPDDVCTLATAIEFVQPVRVTYKPVGSRTKVRIMIEPDAGAGQYLRGRDVSSGGPVRLRLAEIERVNPM